MKLMLNCFHFIPHPSPFILLKRPALDRDDFDFGVDLLLHQPLDCHERTAQGAWATAARALIVNRELLVVEREDFEPAAVGREVRAYALVENLVDASEP